MAHTLNHIVFEATNELYFYENIYKLAEEALENGDWEEELRQLPTESLSVI